jgi:hypothetical protein
VDRRGQALDHLLQLTVAQQAVPFSRCMFLHQIGCNGEQIGLGVLDVATGRPIGAQGA